jgi:hypothetical protein
VAELNVQKLSDVRLAELTEWLAEETDRRARQREQRKRLQMAKQLIKPGKTFVVLLLDPYEPSAGWSMKYMTCQHRIWLEEHSDLPEGGQYLNFDEEALPGQEQALYALMTALAGRDISEVQIYRNFTRAKRALLYFLDQEAKELKSMRAQVNRMTYSLLELQEA